MPDRSLDKLLLRNSERTDAITRKFERTLAGRYRDAYNAIEAQIAALYAKMGEPPSLAEARRYNRLQSVQDAIAKEYKSLINKAIADTRGNSAEVFTEAAYGTEWAYDQHLGLAVKWPVIPVEAIRASVWASPDGQAFDQRYKSWAVKDVLAMQSTITSGLAQGISYPKMAKNVRQVVNKSYAEAIRIVRTESNRNYNQGHLDIYDRLDGLGIKARKQWVATLDTRTRDTHGQLDGQFADENGLFSIHGLTAEAPGLFGDPAEDINCIPEYAIPICMNTENLYKREYSGSIIIIKTASGNEIHVTPNHPILTDNGWVSANGIVNGSNICNVSTGEIFGTANPNVNNNPPISAEVFNLFSVVGTINRVGGSNEQFHGDGLDGNVDIISLDRKLRDDIESILYKPLRKFSFTTANVLHGVLPGNSPVGKFINRSLDTFNGFMRGIGKAMAFLWASISHSLKHGLGSIPRRDSMFNEDSAYPSAMDVKGVCDTFFGFPVDVSFDNVVSVESVPYSGHVYNLHTKQGWYGLYHGNGTMSIVHNCRCRVIEVVDDMAPEYRRIRGEGIVEYQTYEKWAGSRGWNPKTGWDLAAKAKIAEEQARKY